VVREGCRRHARAAHRQRDDLDRIGRLREHRLARRHPLVAKVGRREQNLGRRGIGEPIFVHRIERRRQRGCTCAAAASPASGVAACASSENSS
jgi:hypothetical protein